MSEEPLRSMLAEAVKHLRSATELTMDEIIGLRALPTTVHTPENCYSLGIIEGAAAALRSTPREVLEDHDLYTAAKRP